MERRCCAFSALLALSTITVPTLRAAPEYVVADWTFEEGIVGSAVTQVVDQSGRGHDSISIFGEPKFATGSSLAGLVALDCPAVDGGFRGGSGFNVAEASDLVATNQFTLEAMVFPRDDAVLESERRLIVVRGTGNPGYDFLAYNPTTDRFFFGLARAPRGWGEVEAGFGRDNLFHHIAGSHENGVLKLYRDGYLDKPQAAPYADPDNDRSTNFEEYEAGTHPLDATSGFRASIRTAPLVSWPSVPSRTYRILRKDSLSSPTWTTVVSAFTATNSSSRFADIDAPDTSYYLVELLP